MDYKIKMIFTLTFTLLALCNALFSHISQYCPYELHLYSVMITLLIGVFVLMSSNLGVRVSLLLIIIIIIINFMPYYVGMEKKKELEENKVAVLTSTKNIVTLEEKQLKDPLAFTTNLIEIEKNINSLEALINKYPKRLEQEINSLKLLKEDLKEIKTLTEKLDKSSSVDESKAASSIKLINNKIYLLKEKINSSL